MRTEPPPSVPTDHAPIPRPTATALPPLEPPDVFAGSPGLPVAPCLYESVTPFHEYSGVVVLPRMTAPVSRRRAPLGASCGHGPASSISVLPRRVGQPRVHNASLIDVGTPSPGPQWLTRVPPRLGLLGGGQGALGVHQHEGIHLVVEAVDRFQGLMGGLNRRQGTTPERVYEVDRLPDHRPGPGM